MPDPQTSRVPRSIRLAQCFLGLGAYLFLVVPYLRTVHGFGRLRPDRRWLLVSNHVSLLDTILLGALCWRSGCYPISVLGDKKTWRASWFKRFLSSRIGYLLERGKLNQNRIAELETFGRSGCRFHLVVFPEGTRGDGVHLGPFQPGLHYIAQAARLPIVPIFIENMQRVSTKAGGFHLLGGLRQIEVHIGEPIAPESYLSLEREEFSELVRQSILNLAPRQPAEYSNPVPPSP